MFQNEIICVKLFIAHVIKNHTTLIEDNFSNLVLVTCFFQDRQNLATNITIPLVYFCNLVHNINEGYLAVIFINYSFAICTLDRHQKRHCVGINIQICYQYSVCILWLVNTDQIN